MTLHATDLVLSWGTIAGAGFGDRLAAAAGAGYRGVGLRPVDRERAHAEGLDDVAMRSMLADLGLEVWEIEVLHDWAAGGERGTRSQRFEERLFGLADAVGGHCIVAVGDIPDGVDAAAERLAALARRAADHGLGVAVEFVPFTQVADVATAWEIVRRCGAPNAGIDVDSWHHLRGTGDDAALRAVPAERVFMVQLDDAAAAPASSDPLTDTAHHRLPPGEGELDLRRFVDVVRGMGVDAPWSLEVLSDALAGLPAADAARRCADAALRVLGLEAGTTPRRRPQ